MHPFAASAIHDHTTLQQYIQQHKHKSNSSTMPPTLYHVPRTISSPLVQLVLELNLIEDGEIVVQELTFAELKSPAHLAINIMGTSPAFQCTENALCMWESGAILDFLLEQHDTNFRFHPAPSTKSSTPAELQKRTRYLHLKQFILATVYPFMASLYIQTLQKGGTTPDPDYLAAAHQKCHACLGPALSQALKESGGPYLLGTEVSAVDFLAAKPLGNGQSMGLSGEFPELTRLLELIQARPTYTLAYESQKNIAGGLQGRLLAGGGGAVGQEQAPPEKEDYPPDEQDLILVPRTKAKKTAIVANEFNSAEC